VWQLAGASVRVSDLLRFWFCFSSGFTAVFPVWRVRYKLCTPAYRPVRATLSRLRPFPLQAVRGLLLASQRLQRIKNTRVVAISIAAISLRVSTAAILLRRSARSHAKQAPIFHPASSRRDHSLSHMVMSSSRLLSDQRHTFLSAAPSSTGGWVCSHETAATLVGRS